ncbi:MAG: heavy-metal-associated domain-containing protein [Paracoccaceae bacterium]|uniref:heavy-metal-associated domain-containing protein n=1 Tax=Celeribacter marinus TaxID=1397108 RepID=UPI003173CA53
MSKFNVPDMTCGHCTASIEKAVGSEDGDAVLKFDLEGRTVEITSRLSDDELARLLEKEGYTGTIAA